MQGCFSVLGFFVMVWLVQFCPSLKEEKFVWPLWLLWFGGLILCALSFADAVLHP